MTNNYSYQALFKDQLIVPSLLLKHYVRIGLSETEVMVILQIHRFYMEGNHFPTPNEISNYITLSEQECAQTLRKLIQNNMLSIDQKQNEQDMLSECYSLEKLWSQLYTLKEEQSNNVYEQERNIFILFEQEFGRPLSPFEIETINIWIDDDEQQPSLIKAALREAVLMGKLNFKYIDRILREWKKKGIRSVEQARNHSKSFHTNQNNKEGNKMTNRDVSLYYNWLEEE
ncbi:DNA replication protein [Aquibacillus albus]|uniref:DNA replication protein n=1 Tax=Aquibacillus albus TaxID=1168171 RepID=A0ABS2MVC7_9BACI|nr:DnaD domain-containing protein [Aquibacillus albus]MBM7569859.1 DNA replication protein [Aquibacillus albus]